MKVFGCYIQCYCKGINVGGMIIACGNTLEEAHNSFIFDKKFSAYHIPVFSKNGDYVGNKSIEYPLEKWFEMPELTANCDKSKVLYENSIKV